MIDVIVSGGLNLTVEDTGDIINVIVEVAPSIAVEVVVGVPTKENIVGLTKSDSPEFADVVIPDIAEENSYTAGAWAWLTGLFGVVTWSVKSIIIALVERVSSLENNIIATYTTVLNDEIVEFRNLEITQNSNFCVAITHKYQIASTSFIQMNVNDFNGVHQYANSSRTSFLFALYYNNSQAQAIMTFSGGEVIGDFISMSDNNGSYISASVVSRTVNANINQINSIVFTKPGGFAQNTIITITKI